ncbi:MAG: PIG-L family deacetylase [Candidatus Kuenenbacteria bacterium]
MSKKILVVTAHPDDELLGVGATILKHIDKGDEINILILSDGETSKDSHQDIEGRASQAKQVADFLGVKELFLKQLPDQKFDTVPLLEINKIIEGVVKQVEPHIVYTHAPNDLNLDHQITCKSVLIACRPQPGFSVKKILAFETLSSTEWQVKDSANGFYPTHYENIDKYINKKIKALELYKGELKKYPHPRSSEGIRILAQYRGLEVGYNFAEVFQIIRHLND